MQKLIMKDGQVTVYVHYTDVDTRTITIASDNGRNIELELTPEEVQLLTTALFTFDHS